MINSQTKRNILQANRNFKPNRSEQLLIFINRVEDSVFNADFGIQLVISVLFVAVQRVVTIKAGVSVCTSHASIAVYLFTIIINQSKETPVVICQQLQLDKRAY